MVAAPLASKSRGEDFDLEIWAKKNSTFYLFQVLTTLVFLGSLYIATHVAPGNAITNSIWTTICLFVVLALSNMTFFRAIFFQSMIHLMAITLAITVIQDMQVPGLLTGLFAFAFLGHWGHEAEKKSSRWTLACGFLAFVCAMAAFMGYGKPAEMLTLLFLTWGLTIVVIEADRYIQRTNPQFYQAIALQFAVSYFYLSFLHISLVL